MYVTVLYNKVSFSILHFLTSQLEVDFGIALVGISRNRIYCFRFAKNGTSTVGGDKRIELVTSRGTGRSFRWKTEESKSRCS